MPSSSSDHSQREATPLNLADHPLREATPLSLTERLRREFGVDASESEEEEDRGKGTNDLFSLNYEGVDGCTLLDSMYK